MGGWLPARPAAHLPTCPHGSSPFLVAACHRRRRVHYLHRSHAVPVVLQEAWAEHRAAQMSQGGPASGLPQIVYSSRTHSQLQQVMRELKKLQSYRCAQGGCVHAILHNKLHTLLYLGFAAVLCCALIEFGPGLQQGKESSSGPAW
jgi:hypothetical protein